MTDYHIRAHSTVRAKGLEAPKSDDSKGGQDTLELRYPSDTLEGVPYESLGYRHIHRDFFIFAEKSAKVVIIHQDGRRRVVKIDGLSVEPYFE